MKKKKNLELIEVEISQRDLDSINSEILKGLEALGIEIWYEKADEALYGQNFKTILHIDTPDNRHYSAALHQQFRLTKSKASQPK